MKIKVWKGFWTIQDVRDNSTSLFLFGDNDIGIGKGGQAIIRDEPNSIGIPTKKKPNNEPTSFYTDLEYKTNKIKIKNSINKIIKKINKNNYDTLVLPENGFGTGLADLPNKAPKTLAYLTKIIQKMISRLS